MKRLVEGMLKAEKAQGRIDVALVDAAAIRELNRKFRGKNKATDVLSFNYNEGEILGDVIISRAQAKSRGEIKRLVIHGVLHILGYDHGRKMSHAEKIYAQF